MTQKKRQLLEKIFNSLDPIRLLKQIRNMQDALWQHAVIGIAESSKPVSKVNFNPNAGALSTNDQIESPAAEFLKNSMEREKRQYRRTKKIRVPHY